MERKFVLTEQQSLENVYCFLPITYLLQHACIHPSIFYLFFYSIYFNDTLNTFSFTIRSPTETEITLTLTTSIWPGAGRSSEVERSLMVRWVVGSILHGVDPLSYFSFQPVLHNWCNKGCGMCYPVCGMVHIKEPLLLIDKSSLCGGSRFPFSLSEWSLTICLTTYNRI